MVSFKSLASNQHEKRRKEERLTLISRSTRRELARGWDPESQEEAYRDR